MQAGTRLVFELTVSVMVSGTKEELMRDGRLEFSQVFLAKMNIVHLHI